jgi:hypothetical protein
MDWDHRTWRELVHCNILNSLRFCAFLFFQSLLCIFSTDTGRRLCVIFLELFDGNGKGREPCLWAVELSLQNPNEKKEAFSELSQFPTGKLHSSNLSAFPIFKQQMPLTSTCGVLAW